MKLLRFYSGNKWSPQTSSMAKFLFAPMFFLFAGISNSFFQIYLARTLQPQGFGVFENYWSIISNLALLFSGTQVFAAYAMLAPELSNSPVKGTKTRFDYYLKSSTVVALLITSIVLSLINFGSLRHLTLLPIIVILTSIPNSILGNVMSGKVQGSSHPTELQIWGFLMSFSKVLIVIFLTLVTHDVITIIIVLQVKQLVFGALLLIRNRGRKKINESFFHRKSLQINLHYMLFWLVAGFDVSFFGRKASNVQLGNYAAAANIGKLILIIAVSVPTILFRSILSEEVASNAKNRKRTGNFFLTLGLGLIILVLIIGRDPLFSLIYGKNYSEAANIFIGYAIAMFPLSLYFYELTFKFIELKLKTSIYLFVIAVVQLTGMGFLNLNTSLFLSFIGFGSLGSLLVLKLT